jgi:hypothetical protein
LTKRRYNWLAANYPDGSKWIKKAKDNINGAAAHANIIRGDSTFRIVPGSDAIETPFFDIEDEYSVKIDLGQISVVAIMLMDLFYGVARDVARESRSVIEFRSDFGGTIQGLLAEDKTLGAEIAASDRVKAALLKRAQREQANTAPNPKS